MAPKGSPSVHHLHKNVLHVHTVTLEEFPWSTEAIIVTPGQQDLLECGELFWRYRLEL